MYLHLGGDIAVNTKYIVGIFDIENTTTTGKYTKEYINKAAKAGRVVNVTEELPKSFTVYVEDSKETLYISQISVQTLRKRLAEG